MEHIPVLLDEVIELLSPHSGGIYLDATLGGGGHAEAILEASAPDGRLIGLDQDEIAIRLAGRRLERFGGRYTILRENFRNMAVAIRALQLESLDGILMDVGLSSYQIDDMERGFSFASPAALDMRMDRRQPLKAADLVAEAPEEELLYILRSYGEEREAGRIVRAIARARRVKPIVSGLELADIISGAVSPVRRHGRIHPATKTFQALRIAVNDELDSLKDALESGLHLLNPGGRMAVISFHSLEDRIVKHRFREWAAGCICSREIPVCICGREPLVRLLTRKPVVPSEEETASNPRARSARLRVVERI